MPEKLTTGFEEKELLAIKCHFCNDTGAVPKKTHRNNNDVEIVDEWEDCKVCIHTRIEVKSKVRNVNA